MVSGSELADLEALLLRVMSDPSAFGHAVMDQLLERLSTAPPPRQAPVTVTGRLVDEDLEAVQDRNLLIAAALGACECWGEDLECDLCAGRGTPGWQRPDAQLYEEYVAAATRRMSGSDLNDQPQESEGRTDAHVARQQ
jgi:hypothetical protein